ncbi:hypothetical protein [Streptomyces fagopyri]|uniref:hypothetical protein n=1 Tax=Streptomyces fagopyri TaxID=2662397 RepID=UPI0038249978
MSITLTAADSETEADPGPGLDDVWATAPFGEAAARMEHQCAVAPLLNLFDKDPHGFVEGIRTGRLRAALGLFTPNARFSLSHPTVTAVRDGVDVLLDGRYRYAGEWADVAFVPLAIDGEVRLALLPHSPEARHSDTSPADGYGWRVLSGVRLAAHALSRPVTFDADGPLAAVLDAFGWQFSRGSAELCARVVADLRRTLARSGEGTEALSTSQYVAHELSRLEIEISLASRAASLGAVFKNEGPGGQSAASVLLACTGLLWRTARMAEDLTTELGLPATDSGTGLTTASLQAYFGGRRMVEGELARRMGLLNPEVPGSLA